MTKLKAKTRTKPTLASVASPAADIAVDADESGGLAARGALVAIVVGSHHDLPVMQPASERLTVLGIPHELRVLSAHRTPELAATFARSARQQGLKVIICAAGAAAHLAGAMAAQTTLPIIGVPIAATSLGGLESLLSTVQMPSGIPVATVAIGGADNAALLAAQMLALSDPSLVAGLESHRRGLAATVEKRDAEVRGLRE